MREKLSSSWRWATEPGKLRSRRAERERVGERVWQDMVGKPHLPLPVL